MAKASRNKTKLVAPANSSVAPEIAELVAYITAAEGAWRSLTDGVADLKLTAATRKILKGPTTYKTLKMLRPTVVRLEALGAWLKLTDRMVGWALSADVTTHYLLRQIEDKPPDAKPKNDDRRDLYRFLVAARKREETEKNYVVVTLPKRLAKELSEAVIRLDYGEVAPLFEPLGRKSFKDGYTIPNIREELLWCAHYLFGGGVSMAQAYRKVGEAINQTADAVRNWDRASLYDDHELPYDFIIARLRGALDAGAEFSSSLRRFKLDPSDHMTSMWDEVSQRRFEPHDLKEVAARYRAAIVEQSDAARKARRRPRSR